MLKILDIKIKEQKRQLDEAKQNLKKVIEESCARLKEITESVDNICKSQGEDSDLCQEARFKLLGVKMKLDDTIRRYGGRCP